MTLVLDPQTNAVWECILERTKLLNTLDHIQEEHTKAVSELNAKIKKLTDLITVGANGHDLTKIQVAKDFIAVYGKYSPEGDACYVIRDAELEVAKGGGRLKKVEFGVKNYAHWVNQRCDCTYGFGPTHGSVVFSVGLKNPDVDIPETARDACCYYIQRIPLMEKLKNAE